MSEPSPTDVYGHDMVDVKVKATGKTQGIPRFWLSDPVLSEPFEETAPAEAPPAVPTYADLTVPDLRAEISKRNDGRADAEVIHPGGQTKADLIAALELDDAPPDEMPSLSV